MAHIFMVQIEVHLNNKLDAFIERKFKIIEMLFNLELSIVTYTGQLD